MGRGLPAFGIAVAFAALGFAGCLLPGDDEVTISPPPAGAFAVYDVEDEDRFFFVHHRADAWVLGADLVPVRARLVDVSYTVDAVTTPPGDASVTYAFDATGRLLHYTQFFRGGDESAGYVDAQEEGRADLSLGVVSQARELTVGERLRMDWGDRDGAPDSGPATYLTAGWARGADGTSHVRLVAASAVGESLDELFPRYVYEFTDPTGFPDRITMQFRPGADPGRVFTKVHTGTEEPKAEPDAPWDLMPTPPLSTWQGVHPPGFLTLFDDRAFSTATAWQAVEEDEKMGEFLAANPDVRALHAWFWVEEDYDAGPWWNIHGNRQGSGYAGFHLVADNGTRTASAMVTHVHRQWLGVDRQNETEVDERTILDRPRSGRDLLPSGPVWDARDVVATACWLADRCDDVASVQYDVRHRDPERRSAPSLLYTTLFDSDSGRVPQLEILADEGTIHRADLPADKVAWFVGPAAWLEA